MASGLHDKYSAQALRTDQLASIQRTQLAALYQAPDPFPRSVFPQLNSLKKEIKRSQQKAFLERLERIRNMDPLDWSTGTRANRPFEQAFAPKAQFRFESGSLATIRTTPKPPTQYYLDQLALATAPSPPTSPIKEEPIEVNHGLLGEFVILTVHKYIQPSFDFFSSALSTILGFFSLVLMYGLVKPKKIVGGLVSRIDPETMMAFVVAVVVVKWGLALGGGDGDGEELVVSVVEKPVYIIQIPRSSSMKGVW